MKANIVFIMIYFFLLINIIISNKTSQYHCGVNKLKIKPKNIEPKIKVNIEDPSYKRRMSDIDEDGFKNFNIYVDKINIEKDITKYKMEKYRTLILNSIDKAANALQKLLKVKPLENGIQFSDEELNDIEIYNWDSNKFGDYAVRRNIDMNQLGIDLIIFSKIEDLDEYTIAQASSRYTQNSNHQPLLGIVEINSNINFNAANIDKYLENTLIHEITHLLGFSGYFFEDYFNFIMKKKDKYGIQRVYINSPKAVEMARKYYNCPSLDGVELENYGDEGTAGSHWEARILLGDYMNGISYTEEVISEITLALLEDMGFYKANYYTGGLMRYGKNKGCEFVYDKCVDQTTYEINPKFENEFLVNMQLNNVMGPSCSSGRLTRMYSVWRLFDDIPEEYQYNENNEYGGWSAADYCPVPVYDFSEENDINYSGICSGNEGGVYGSKITYFNSDGTKSYYKSKDITDITGEEISENSFCFLSTLYKDTIQDVEYYSKTIRSICYKLFCSDKSLTVKIHDDYIVCPRAGGKIKAKGYKGYFLCPDYNLMCSGTVMCNDLFDCIDKQSEVKEESFIYDYEIKTSQNIKKAEESDFDINNYELSNNGLCQKNCKQCKGNKICQECREGYILLGNYENNEIICEKNTNNKFNIGYFQENDIYYKCIDFCDKCSNKNTCEKCEDGVNYQDNKCINYNIPNCAQSDAHGVCEKCENNFAFNDTNINFCKNKNEFNDNYYTKNNGISYTLCSKGISNCEQCEYDNLNKKLQCKLCEEDYSLSVNENKCILKEEIENDKEYHYIDKLKFKCQKCSDSMNNCLKCENGNVCDKCMKGYYFINDKVDDCYKKSEINMREFFLNEDKTTYLSCNSYNIIDNCKECSNKYFCKECMDGYFLNDEECYLDEDNANYIKIYNSFLLYLTLVFVYLL